ncbi:hypothetical protein REPUB_Repub12eG0063000 [Reevesia pubescens]
MRVFDWEREQWIEFLRAIADYSVSLKEDDTLIWKFSTCGTYSAKSFCNIIMYNAVVFGAHWNLLWAGLTPLKVEAFCWLLLKEKVVVKEFLAANGVWSIWLFRNNVVFNGKVFDLVQIVCIIKYRVASWLKAKRPDLVAPFEDIFRSPILVAVPLPKKSLRPISGWSAPLHGLLKLNIDGSTLGKPGLTGISGLLRNEFGERLLVFSKSVGVTDSNKTEFLAIIEAFSIFSISKWAGSFGLIVESDSSNAVKWFNGHETIPWKLKKLCPLIDSLKNVVLKWKVQHVFRESNDLADGLTKVGVYRSTNLLLVLG